MGRGRVGRFAGLGQEHFAAAHLAHVFAAGVADELVLADRPDAAQLQELIKSADRRLIVCASPGLLPKGLPEHWWLSSWTRDELIEYLLATRRDKCAAVLASIDASAGQELLGDSAELWAAVLDQMTTDEKLPDGDRTRAGDSFATATDPVALGRSQILLASRARSRPDR